MSSPLASSRASLGALDFGVIEAGGVAWVLNKLDGWAGSPGPTLQVTQKPRSSGGWAGPSYSTARNLALSGTVDAPSTLLLSDAADRLSDACSLTDTTLTVIEAGRTRYCTVRRAGEVLVTPLEGSDLAANWSIQLVALDPRKYGPMTSGSTNLPSSSGGRTWPVTWPEVWSGVATSGTVTIPNIGKIAAPVVIRIDGPVVAPSVTRVSGTGDTKVLAFSLTLAAGEYLLINTDPSVRSVLANGQSSRSGYLTSRAWFLAEKGINTYGFNAGVYNSAAQMTVTVSTGAW